MAHSRRGPRGLTAAVIALALASGVAGPPQGARATPPGVQVLPRIYEMNAGVSQAEICVDEKTTIVVYLVESALYGQAGNSGAQQVQLLSHRGDTISPNVGNTAVGDVAPPSAVVGGPGAAATFSFTGKREGETPITVTDTSDTRFQPTTVRVKVSDCYYVVTIVSDWRVRGGWNETYTSRIVQAELHRDPATSRFRNLSADVQSTAEGHPMQGCVPEFKINPSKAFLSGDLINGGRTLRISADYFAFPVETIAHCPGGVTQSSPMGSGQPGHLEARFPAVGGPVIAVRHAARGRVGSLNGTANVSALRVRP